MGCRRVCAVWARPVRPNNHAVLVDPNSIGNVDHTEQAPDHVPGVDQRRMLGSGRLDIGTPWLRAKCFHTHGDDFNTLMVNFTSQFLPPGQVTSAASIGGPGDEHDLGAAK